MPDGNPSSETKEQRAAYNKKYREANKEKCNQLHKEWRLANKDRFKKIHTKGRLNREEKAKETQRKYLYNLPAEHYELMHQQQQGRCTICEGELKKDKQTHIDHNHKTGLVRGLLCHHCNLGLGHFKDDISSLLNAIKYLEADGKLHTFSTQEDSQFSLPL